MKSYNTVEVYSVKLSDLKIGESSIVKKINSCEDVKVRLYDMGLIEGTKIQLILVSPSKKIKAYSFRNTLIALRDIDSKNIIVGDIND